MEGVACYFLYNFKEFTDQCFFTHPIDVPLMYHKFGYK